MYEVEFTNKNVVMIVFVAILLLAVLIVTNNLLVSVVALSVIANIFVIRNIIKTRKPAAPKVEEPVKTLESVLADPKPQPPPAQADTVLDDNFAVNSSIYGNNRDMYESCKSVPTLNKWSSVLGPVSNADAAIANLTMRRYRDKEAMDGSLVKDANYYKHHYGDEFVNEENKPWWSREEY